jgi:hypothetical protein
MHYDSYEEHDTKSSTYEVPEAMSTDESQALIEALTQWDNENQQRVKDLIYSTLLLVNGGLVALSFLLFQGLISLGVVDLATGISLIAFAVALPLLAASFWCIKIWYGTFQPPRHMQKVTSPDGKKYVRFESSVTSKLTGNFVDVTGLWIVLLTAGITFIGIFATLWHAFWVASVIFIVAVIIGCGFVLRLLDHFFDTQFSLSARNSIYMTHVEQWYRGKEGHPGPAL